MDFTAAVPAPRKTTPQLKIKRLRRRGEMRACAEIAAASEPWIMLGRDFDNVLKVLSEPGHEIYIAHSESALTGFIVIEMRGALKGYIRMIAVASAWRNRGVGTRLIKFAEKRIFRESRNVFLFVSSFNTQAQRLYARLGYQRIGELKDYIVKGHSEFLMRKTTGPMLR